MGLFFIHLSQVWFIMNLNNKIGCDHVYKILVAEDEQKLRRLIVEYLVAEGYDYLEAPNGKAAIDIFEAHNPGEIDAIILDVMMPMVDGWTVCREIRKTSEVPVIMLTARGEEYDKLFGFELGVDDYMTKPFSPKELMARLKALIKRSGKKTEQTRLQFEGIEIDLEARNVYMDGQMIKLTPKEYDLLAYFIENKNRALSRQQILDGVWGIDFFGDDRTVDTHVKMLRDSLKKYRHLFVTVWGMGYKFESVGGKDA